MTYLERATTLYEMLTSGQAMAAFEQYYHDDVVVVEPTGETRRGKDAQRTAIQDWRASVDELHASETEWITSNEDEAVTMVLSATDLTMRGRRTTRREIAVQQWDGDQIVHEAFFYYVPADVQRARVAG